MWDLPSLFVLWDLGFFVLWDFGVLGLWIWGSGCRRLIGSPFPVDVYQIRLRKGGVLCVQKWCVDGVDRYSLALSCAQPGFGSGVLQGPGNER